MALSAGQKREENPGSQEKRHRLTGQSGHVLSMQRPGRLKFSRRYTLKLLSETCVQWRNGQFLVTFYTKHIF